MGRLSDAEVYASQLLRCHHGYPLWRPEPYESLPELYRLTGTRLGDVGRITHDGHFHFLFNVLAPADDPVNARGVPDDFEPLSFDISKVLKCVIHESGEPIYSLGTKRYELAADATAQILGTPAEGSSGIELKFEDREGALLLLPEGATRVDVETIIPFRQYAHQHCESWYRFAESCGIEVENGALYFVTGYDKTSSWENAVFSRPSRNASVSLKLTSGIGPGGKLQLSQSTNHITPVVKGRNRLDCGTNQSVFIRGFKITLRSTARSMFQSPIKLMDLSSGNLRDLKPRDVIARGGPVRGTRQSLSRSQSSSSSSLSRSYDASGHSLSSRLGWPNFSSPVNQDESRHENRIAAYSDSEDSDLDSDMEYGNEQLETDYDSTSDTDSDDEFSFRGPTSLNYPSNVLNDHLLDLISDCDVAITHDDDWCELLDKSDSEMPLEEELLARAMSKYEIVNENGCVFFQKKSVVNTLASNRMQTNGSPQTENQPRDSGSAMDTAYPDIYPVNDREVLLSSIQPWANGPAPSSNGYWIQGMAGCGKSTVCLPVLSAATSWDWDSFLSIFVTPPPLQLVEYSPDTSISPYFSPHQACMAAEVTLQDLQDPNGKTSQMAGSQNPRVVHTPDLSMQLKHLILEPLGKQHHLTTEGPIIVIIDGLDECTRADSTGTNFRRQVLQLLINNPFRLFPYLRLIVASRPEEDIKEMLTSRKHIVAYPLDTTSEKTKEDVKKFIDYKPREAEERNPQLVGSYPSFRDDAINELLQRSDRLCIWAPKSVAFKNRSSSPMPEFLTTVKLFLEKEVDINLQGGAYDTALQAASTPSHKDTMRLLPEKGKEISSHLVSGGGFTNIYQGRRPQNEATYTDSDERFWHEVNKSNLLPLLNANLSSSFFMPWIMRVQYIISSSKGSRQNLLTVMSDIAADLNYLHFLEPPVLHGGIKGSNNKQRKASRRANTASRRATHNAVEGQRRETLNGRFLDLAAPLPNLSQIRRPSKSFIVNSSIAHIHASRRHRLLASRELRAVKLEADALRRELNEWNRAAIPRFEEPVRGEGFSMVLSGELEVPGVGGGLGGLMEEGMDGDEDGDYGFLDYGDHLPQGQGMEEIFVPEPQVQQTVPTMMARIPSQQQMAHQGGNVQERMERFKRLERLDRLDSIERSQGPMVASPTSVAFDFPAVPGMYEPRIMPGGYQMMQGGNNGMGMGVQGGMGQMGMGMSPYEQMQGKGFNNGMGMPMQHPHQMQRTPSGSMSASSSGSASPPLPQWAQGPQQGMGQGQMQMGQQGMQMMGGMGGMGGQNVAFGIM